MYNRAVNSWLPPVFVVFVAFAVAVLLIDDFPIQADGLLSIHTAGYTDDYPDLLPVFDRLINKSQQHVPGYFLALFVWGNVTDWSPLLLRVLTVFFGILSLALIYRLGRDFISKEAGFFAIVMLASLTFYNIWYLPIRMYTLFVAAELWLFWVYFRTLHRKQANRRDYALLFLAGLLFVNTHTFSLTILGGLGVYHLLFVKKTRRWYSMTAAALLVVLIILPWFVILVQGAEYYASNPERTYPALSPIEMTVKIFELGLNESLLFMGVLLLSVKQALNRDKMTIAFWVILIVAIGLYAAINTIVMVADPTRFRYFVPLFPLMILLMVKGLELLKRWKFIVLCILLFWVAGGLLYHRRVRPDFYVRSYDTIPIHLIERHLRDKFDDGDLITGWTDGLDFSFASDYYGRIVDFYFDSPEKAEVEIAIQHVYQLGQVSDEAVTAIVTDLTQDRKRIWLTYEPDNRHTARLYELYHHVLMSRYERCLIDDAISDVIIEFYQTADCG